MVRLNQAVALAMVAGARAGLARLAELEADPRLADDHRLHAARAHLLERDDDPTPPGTAYRTAARLARSVPQQRYLMAGRSADRHA